MVSYKALNTIFKAITSNRSYRGWNGYAFQTFTIFEAARTYIFYIRGYFYTFLGRDVPFRGAVGQVSWLERGLIVSARREIGMASTEKQWFRYLVHRKTMHNFCAKISNKTCCARPERLGMMLLVALPPIGHSTETGGVVCWFFSTLVSVSFGVLLPVASRHSPQWLHRACCNLLETDADNN